MSATRHRSNIRSAATWYFAAWVLGASLTVAALDPRLTGFGVGLMAPGAGLAYHGHWVELALVVAGVAFAVRIHAFGLLAWAWFALAALMLTHTPEPGEAWPAAQWVVPIATAPVVVAAAGLSLRRLRSARRSNRVHQPADGGRNGRPARLRPGKPPRLPGQASPAAESESNTHPEDPT